MLDEIDPVSGCDIGRFFRYFLLQPHFFCGIEADQEGGINPAADIQTAVQRLTGLKFPIGNSMSQFGQKVV